MTTETGITFTLPSLTQQEFADDVDIHKILDRYRRTGVLPAAQAAHAQYGDFSRVGDYESALRLVRATTEVFESLPAHVRDALDNNPATFVDFASDPENRNQLIEWGLSPEYDLKRTSIATPNGPPAEESEPEPNTSSELAE